jgi:hypothetical protein
MERSPSREAESHSISQEISRLLWNPKVHYRVHNSPSLVLILRYSQSAPFNPIFIRSIIILPYHLRLGLPSGLFPSGFPTKILYTFLISPIRATCHTHFILLDLITLRIFGEAYKL